MTEARRQTAFAGLDRPQAWPATRGRLRPQLLDAALDTLPGVGPSLKRTLGRLGLETVRDLLEHRPFRYESAVDEVSIADLRGDGEAAIAGDVLNVSHAHAPRPALPGGRADLRRDGDDQRRVVQPAVGGRAARARHARAAAWKERALRVRRQVLGRRARRARRPTSRRCIPRARRSRRSGCARSSLRPSSAPSTLATRFRPSCVRAKGSR